MKVIAAAIASLMLGACQQTVESRATTGGQAAPASSKHVFVIVLENHTYEQIIGSPDAPYINALAKRYGLATNYHGITHPSLPNYLAMIGGSTFGITNDCTTCSVRATNLADQLERAHLSWKGYMEGMPYSCFGGSTRGRYAKRHNPFVYFQDIARNPKRCGAHVVPLSRFAADARANTIPNFSFITPDVCHDMHDCDIATGDTWLASFVPTIIATNAFKSGGVLALTTDENEGRAPGNHVEAIIASTTTTPGRRSSVWFNHYSLLRTIEDIFGLPHLLHAGDRGRRSMSALLQ